MHYVYKPWHHESGVNQRESVRQQTAFGETCGLHSSEWHLSKSSGGEHLLKCAAELARRLN